MRRGNVMVSSVVLIIVIPAYAARALGLFFVDMRSSNWILACLPLLPLLLLIWNVDRNKSTTSSSTEKRELSATPAGLVVGALIRHNALQGSNVIPLYVLCFSLASAFTSRWLDSWPATFYGSAMTVGLTLLSDATNAMIATSLFPPPFVRAVFFLAHHFSAAKQETYSIHVVPVAQELLICCLLTYITVRTRVLFVDSLPTTKSAHKRSSKEDAESATVTGTETEEDPADSMIARKPPTLPRLVSSYAISPAVAKTTAASAATNSASSVAKSADTVADGEEDVDNRVRALLSANFQDHDTIIDQVNRLVRKAKSARSSARVRRFERKELSFEDFELDRRLTNGGFCTVYSGFLKSATSQLKRPCAIKTFSTADSASSTAIHGLVQEIIILSELDHPHIVRVLGYCWEPHVCLVMEFMPSGTLHDMLACKTLALTWVSPLLEIAQQLASALAYLHALTPPVVHRDIKVRNVLLLDFRTCKLADFGLAVTGGATKSRAGTARYAAPEVVADGECSVRSDAWSLGVTLWEMAVRAQFDPEIFSGREDRTYDCIFPTQNLPYEVPWVVADIVAKLLRFRPEDRSTCADVERRIGQVDLDDVKYLDTAAVAEQPEEAPLTSSSANTASTVGSKSRHHRQHHHQVHASGNFPPRHPRHNNALPKLGRADGGEGDASSRSGGTSLVSPSRDDSPSQASGPTKSLDSDSSSVVSVRPYVLGSAGGSSSSSSNTVASARRALDPKTNKFSWPPSASSSSVTSTSLLRPPASSPSRSASSVSIPAHLSQLRGSRPVDWVMASDLSVSEDAQDFRLEQIWRHALPTTASSTAQRQPAPQKTRRVSFLQDTFVMERSDEDEEDSKETVGQQEADGKASPPAPVSSKIRTGTLGDRLRFAEMQHGTRAGAATSARGRVERRSRDDDSIDYGGLASNASPVAPDLGPRVLPASRIKSIGERLRDAELRSGSMQAPQPLLSAAKTRALGDRLREAELNASTTLGRSLVEQPVLFPSSRSQAEKEEESDDEPHSPLVVETEEDLERAPMNANVYEPAGEDGEAPEPFPTLPAHKLRSIGDRLREAELSAAIGPTITSPAAYAAASTSQGLARVSEESSMSWEETSTLHLPTRQIRLIGTRLRDAELNSALTEASEVESRAASVERRVLLESGEDEDPVQADFPVALSDQKSRSMAARLRQAELTWTTESARRGEDVEEEDMEEEEETLAAHALEAAIQDSPMLANVYEDTSEDEDSDGSEGPAFVESPSARQLRDISDRLRDAELGASGSVARHIDLNGDDEEDEEEEEEEESEEVVPELIPRLSANKAKSMSERLKSAELLHHRS